MRWHPEQEIGELELLLPILVPDQPARRLQTILAADGQCRIVAYDPSDATAAPILHARARLLAPDAGTACSAGNRWRHTGGARHLLRRAGAARHRLWPVVPGLARPAADRRRSVDGRAGAAGGGGGRGGLYAASCPAGCGPAGRGRSAAGRRVRRHPGAGADRARAPVAAGRGGAAGDGRGPARG